MYIVLIIWNFKGDMSIGLIYQIDLGFLIFYYKLVPIS